MSDEFDRELTSAREELDAARRELLPVVSALSDGDLDRERRGGWAVRRVLGHVIESEWLYANLVAHLRGTPAPGDVVSGGPSSAADAAQRLDASRRALLSALDGVDEASFYRLSVVGHEEYSIISVLENTANHDREHAGQIQAIVNE
ncbi:MAG: DinB family protein [Chloroflexi bacterium]|nr:DinB family protein [Chloroflexota bacterium]